MTANTSDSLISVYVTYPDQDTARSVSRSLVQEHLAACANMFPIESIYVWQDAVHEEPEVAVFYKTRASLWEFIRDRILALHPYTTPAILRFEIGAHENYLQWVFNHSRHP